jgi:monoamine oxidase
VFGFSLPLHTVHTNRNQELKAKYVVMAAPLNVLQDIKFSPSISAIKQKAFKQGHTGSGVKIYVKVKGKHPIVFANGTEEMALNYLWTEYDDDDQVLVGYGKDPQKIDFYDDEMVQKVVQEYLPEAEVLESFSYDWNIDPYSKGTWCMYPPGMLSEAFEEMNSPEGVVYFAGSDFASGWRGFLDGAIESGARNAQLIIEKLKNR